MRFLKFLQKDQRGFLPREVLFLSIFIVVCIGLLVLGYRFETAKARDAQRLADMRTVQHAFLKLWLETASYRNAAENGCSDEGMLVSRCRLQDEAISIAQLRDPGTAQYRVTKVPDDTGYEITFTLEQSYGNLKRGTHTLTELGIQ